MNKRAVALIAGGVGLAVFVASAAALTHTLNPPVQLVDETTSRHSRIQCESQLRQAAEETVESSVLVVPTVTVVGDVPRRGVAEMQPQR